MYRPDFRFAIAFAALLAGPPALAGEITLQISVLDSDAFALRAPQGDTRWIIEGPGDFSLAEEHGAVPEMTYDLAPRTYRITVWELDTQAAAEHRATLTGDQTETAYLLLAPVRAHLADAAMERMNRPEPPAPAKTPRQAAAARPPSAAPAAASSIATPAPSPEVAAPMGVVIGPGSVLVVSLPDLPDPENDYVGLADEGRGWLSTVERGGLSEAALTLPDVPGSYRLEYVAVPEMEVLSTLEVTVR